MRKGVMIPLATAAAAVVLCAVFSGVRLAVFITYAVLCVLICVYRFVCTGLHRYTKKSVDHIVCSACFAALIVVIQMIKRVFFPYSGYGLYDLPELLCLILTAVFEGFAVTAPLDLDYYSFFSASSIKAGLTDNNFRVKLKSPLGITPFPEQITDAERSPVYLTDNVTLLKSVKVDGGHFYWTEDMSELLKLDDRLKDTQNYLTEEHALLNEAARIEETRRRTEEQNRLFDGIAESLKPQLDRIEEILNGLPEDEAEFCREMKYAGVLGAYVKRYSNLLLLSSAESIADSSELYLCINESFSYLRLLGAFCCSDIQSGIELPLSCQLLMYELFEAVIESAAPSVSAVFVTLKRDTRGITYYIEASSDNAAIDKSFYDRAKEAGFRIDSEHSDGCFFIVMSKEEAKL